MTYPPPGGDPYGQQPPQDPFGQPPQYPGTDPYGQQQQPPPQYPGADPYGQQQQQQPQYPGYPPSGEPPTMQAYPAGVPQTGWPPQPAAAPGSGGPGGYYPPTPPGGYGGYPGYGAPQPRQSRTGLLVVLLAVAAVVVLGGAAVGVYLISGQGDDSGSSQAGGQQGQQGGQNGNTNGNTEGNGTGPLSCQAADQQGAPLPDRETVEVTLNLSCPGSAPSMTVTVDITHTYVPDLSIRLRAPDGHVYELWDRGQGTRSDGGISETFQVDVAGRVLDGAWTLIVEDHLALDEGNLNRWSIDVSG